MPDQQDVDGVNGVTERDFSDWKRHPVSKVFRKYIEDFAAVMRDQHLTDWLQTSPGVAPNPVLMAEMKGRVRTLMELSELSFSDIQQFYPSKEDQDATETIEDRADGV